MAAVLATASVSTAVIAAAGCIDGPAAALLCPPAMLAAPLGARCTARLNCDQIRRVLAYFLLAAAPLLPLKFYLFQQPAAAPAGAAAGEGQQPAAAPAGAAAGEGQQQGPPLGAGERQQAAPPTPEDRSSGGRPDSWASRLVQGMPPPGTAAVLASIGGIAGLVGGLLGIGPATLGESRHTLRQLLAKGGVGCGVLIACRRQLGTRCQRPCLPVRQPSCWRPPHISSHLSRRAPQ